MQLEIHNRLGNPQVIECTRVVVLDNHGNPVSVSLEYDENTIITAHADDEGFNQMLRDCGIGKSVIVVNPKQKPIQEITFPD